MTQQDRLLKYKMSLLQLAEQLQNIRKACNVMGVSECMLNLVEIKKRPS